MPPSSKGLTAVKFLDLFSIFSYIRPPKRPKRSLKRTLFRLSLIAMSDSQTSSLPETPTPSANLAVASWAALVPLLQGDEPPLTRQVEGLLFERRNRPISVRRGSKISPIWAAGTWYTATNDGKLYEAWLCGQCNAFIRLGSSSSSNTTVHWKLRHADKPLDSGLVETSPVPITPQPVQRQLYKDVNIERWRAKVLRWMIQDHIPFSQIESGSFRDVLAELHPLIERYLVSRRTIRSWIDEEFESAIDQV